MMIQSSFDHPLPEDFAVLAFSEQMLHNLFANAADPQFAVTAAKSYAYEAANGLLWFRIPRGDITATMMRRDITMVADVIMTINAATKMATIVKARAAIAVAGVTAFHWNGVWDHLDTLPLVQINPLTPGGIYVYGIFPT